MAGRRAASSVRSTGGSLKPLSNAPGEPSFDGLFKWAFGKDWDWRKFDLDRDMPKVDAELGPILNGAATGDFSKFHARGGKLIIFQGWADPIVSPYQTIALLQGAQRQVRRRSGDAEVRQALHGARRRPLRHRRRTQRLRLRQLSGRRSRRQPTRIMTCSPRSRAGSRTESLRAMSSRRAMSATTPRRESRCSVRFVPTRKRRGTRVAETRTSPEISPALLKANSRAIGGRRKRE